MKRNGKQRTIDRGQRSEVSASRSLSGLQNTRQQISIVLLPSYQNKGVLLLES